MAETVEAPKVKIIVKRHEKFAPLYDRTEEDNLFIVIGGRGGMKTYEVSKWVAFESTKHKKRCAILRDEHSLVRESILNEILLRFDTANKGGRLDNFERLATGIKDRETDSMLVFTKGFKASDKQKKANLKSISDIDIAVIEEMEDIRDEEKFNTFVDSIRKPGSVVVCILNTPDINHFLVKRYFNKEAVYLNGERQDGYFKITPKNIPGLRVIQTSFEDNVHLPEHVVSRYKGYGDPNHHLYNLHYYLTAICGYASTGRRGQIFTKVKVISLKDYLALPFKERYGQDFGTASPAGLLGAKFNGNNMYMREINYKPMSTLEIGRTYCRLKFNDRDKIVADSADKEACDKLSSGWRPDELDKDDINLYPRLLKGFYIIRAHKGQGSVRSGISLMTGMVLWAVEESTNLWNEVYNYVYDEDKNGEPTDEPKDEYNHLLDPARYLAENNKGNTHENDSGYTKMN
jgi:PBSX family phage terminase large subunit